MPRGWSWDPSLFRGVAPYYQRGRLPYPPALADAFARSADLTGTPRLLDVGCGPGSIALLLARLFHEVVGVDPDPDMLVEAKRAAADGGVANARWVNLRAEDLPAGLGSFRFATFAQSFHWMERERVASIMFEMLEPGGAFVHVDTAVAPLPPAELPLPEPPAEEIDALRVAYLGAERRAGQGVLAHGTPSGETDVLLEAGFAPPSLVPVRTPPFVERDADDVVAGVFSSSATAPHLFGDRRAAFERDLRAVLAAGSPSGRFVERQRPVTLIFYRRPTTGRE